MALSNPFDQPPNAPFVKDASIWANWSKWFWQLWRRVNTGALGGTVTSVNVSGGTTGLTTSGGPITTSGTITIAGTLDTANGGTGLTAAGTAGNVLTSDGADWTSAAPVASGTVTSVGLSLPTSVFDVTGSPVTTSGTLTATFDTQSANTFFAGPTTGAATTPTFRALVAADMPSGVAALKQVYNNENLVIDDNIQVTGHATLSFTGTGTLILNGTGSLALL